MSKEKKDSQSKDIEKNKDMASYSYFWIFSLYVYMVKRKSKYAQFHAKQGIVLFLLSFATAVPIFTFPLGFVLFLVSFWGYVKAQEGKWNKVPFVYDLSKKIKF